MNDSDKKLLAGCYMACMSFANFVMIGVVFIYAITHW